MDEQNILHLLRTIRVDARKRSISGSRQAARWLTISCPFAPFTHAKAKDANPSFGITINDGGLSYYKCLACGMKGRLAGLPTRLGGYRKKDYKKARLWAEQTELQVQVARPVPDWEQADPLQSIATGKADAATRGRVSDYPLALGHPYLRERGLTVLDTLHLNIRHDAWQRRVLFPVYDPQHRFVGFTGRSTKRRKKWPKSDPKVRDYFGLNKREVMLGLRGTQQGKVIITEGLFDYAKLVSLGYANAKAILGTALTPEKIDILIEAGDPVYFFMDNDLAGWQALFGTPDPDGGYQTENAWAYRLYREIPVWVVPWPTIFSGSDPGSLASKTQVEGFLKRAWLYTGKLPLDDENQPAWFI